MVRIVEALAADPLIDVLRDKEDILPAEAWSERLAAMILQADAFALFLSPNATSSAEVGREVELALKLGKRIVPVVVRETPPGQVAAAVARLNYLFLREGDDFAAGIASLREAVQTDIVWVREHTRIGELASRWEAAGRRSADLLRGPTLEAAESWMARQPATAPQATALQRGFVAECRRAATRRQRNWVLGSTSVAALAIGLSIVALWQWHEAAVQRTDAQAKRLVAEAEAALAEPLHDGEAPVQALLTSISLHDSEAARRALMRGTRRLEPTPAARLPWPEGIEREGILQFDFSPDGKHLVVMGRHALAAWSVPDGRLAWSRPHRPMADGARLVFAPDGLHAVVMPGGEVVDLPTGTLAPAPRPGARDLAVIDTRLVALVDGATGRDAIAVDAISGHELWRVTVDAPLKAARLVSRTEPFRMPLNPMMLLSMEPRLDGAAVLLDTHGTLSVAYSDPDQRAPARLAMTRRVPAGATVLAIGERGRLVALQRADGRVTVLDLLAKQEVWKGGPEDKPPVSFVGYDRFLSVASSSGPRLQALGGGPGVTIEDARRSDWDMQALGNLGRYSAIIAAAPSDDGSLLATAWKDGRIDVWRPGSKPRYGAIDGVPRMNFERVAGLDHGEALGATVSWTAPPALFMSPTGRFVATQSMGLETNAVGGVMAQHPKVRVWDTRSAIEVARFARPAVFLLRFSANDEWLATVALSYDARKDTPQAPAVELWSLAEPQAEVTRRAVRVALPAPDAASSVAPASAGAVAGISPEMVARMQAAFARAALPTVETSPRAWLGIDGKLRLADAAHGRAVVLADLREALSQASESSARHLQALSSQSALADDEPTRNVLEQLAKQGSAMPGPASMLAEMQAKLSAAGVAPLPGVPVAVAGNGRYVVLKLGRRLLTVALDGSAAVREADIEGDLGVDPFAFDARSITVSANGRYVAFERIDGAALLEAVHRVSAAARRAEEDGDRPSPAAPPRPQDLNREIVIVDVETQRVVGTWPAERQLWPINSPLGPLQTASQPLAVSDDGRKLALERRRIELMPGAAPTSQARLAVADLSRRALVDLGSWKPMPSPFDFGEIAAATPIAAAFSPTAGTLVIEESQPDCPMTVVPHPTSMLPTKVPSCGDVLTRLTRWDAHDGTLVNAVSYRRKASMRADAQVPLPFSGTPRTPATLALTDGHTVTRTVTAWLPAPLDAPAPWALEVIDELIDLDQPRADISWACGRLSQQMRQLAADTWRTQLPGEAQRAICPSTSAR